MWSFLKPVVSAPHFPGKDQTHAARWLNRLALTLVALVSADSILVLQGVLDQAALVQILLINTVGLAINLGALLLMRRGLVKIAALLLLLVLFILITYTTAFVFRSIRTPNILSYFALIPLAGLLLACLLIGLWAPGFRLRFAGETASKRQSPLGNSSGGLAGALHLSRAK